MPRITAGTVLNSTLMSVTTPSTMRQAPLPEFLDRARAAGLELLREEDVTERALPTLELASHWLERYGVGSLEIVSDQWHHRHPWLHRLGAALFGRRIGKHLERGRTTCDPELFRLHNRYERMLFRVPAS